MTSPEPDNFDADLPEELDASESDSSRVIRYELRQTFRYRYEGPVAKVDQRLVVVPPLRHGGQVRRSHELWVVGAEGRAEWISDAFENAVARVHVPAVDEEVEFTVNVVIERVMDGETVMPASSLRDPRYLEPTALTTPDDALLAAARDAISGAHSLEDAAERLCYHVNRTVAYRKGATKVSTTAAEAFEIGAGVCQDHAHVMLAMCRAVGLPARYVSGHMLGEGSTHAWVEAILPHPEDADAAVAVPFDPCHGRRTDTTYVTVAVGRDYMDVAPVSGTYFGAYANQLISVTHLEVKAGDSAAG